MSRKLGQISTGVSFLDMILDGGQYRGGTHGVLMPTGTGKSHLALMIAAGSALAESDLEENGKWLYISDHVELPDLQKNVLSFASKVPRESLREKFKSESDEGKRFRWVADRINRSFAAVCGEEWRSLYSRCKEGSNPWELVNRLILAQSRSGRIAGIVIDDTSKMSLPTVCRPDGRRMADYEVLNEVAKTWAPKWAKHYQCPVWLMHSTNSTASSAQPLAELSAANALHCRTFGPALDVCLVAGKRVVCNGNEVSVIQCCRNIFRPAGEQKSRRMLIKFDQSIAEIVEARDFYEDFDRETIMQRACSASIRTASNLRHLEAVRKQLADVQIPSRNDGPVDSGS